MRTKTTKRILPIRTMTALTAALTLSAPPLTPPAAAQCPGLFRLDWVGTNGVEGGKTFDEPIRFGIFLSSDGECGLASSLLVESDVDPTDAVLLMSPWGGRNDGLVNLVLSRGPVSRNGRIGGGSAENTRFISTIEQDSWVIGGTFDVGENGEYCADFSPFDDEDVQCISGNPGYPGAWITSIDRRGRSVWTRLFAGSGWITAVAAAVPDAEYVVMTGYFTDSMDLDPGPGEAWFTENGGRDAYLLCLDVDGGFRWAVAIGDWSQDQGEHLATDPDGNIYWLGRFSQTVDFDPGPGVDEHTSISGSDMFISKYTPDGVYQWTRTVNRNQGHAGTTIDFGVDGLMMIAGGFNDRTDFDPTDGVDERRSAGESDAFVSMWTTDGDYLWTHTFGAEGYDGADAWFDADGGIVITGNFSSTVDFDTGPGVDVRTSAGGNDSYLGRYSSTGQYLWVQTFGGPSEDAVMRSAYHKPTDELWLDGLFMGTVDFDPGPGEAIRTSVGERDLFLMKMRCAGGGCAELTGHSATGRSGKAQSTVATTLPAGKAALRLADDAGHTIATQKATIAPDGAASATFKRLPRGMYRLTVTQLKNAEGNKVCRGAFLERRVEVR